MFDEHQKRKIKNKELKGIINDKDWLTKDKAQSLLDEAFKRRKSSKDKM